MIYLYDRTVRAVVGEAGNGSVTIERVCVEEAPPLSIVNGQVTDEGAFGQFLKGFWERNQLPKKDVCLVVDSTQTAVRFFDAPRMPHRKMMRCLPGRFIGIERMQDPVYSCGCLEKDRKGREGREETRMYGAVMDRSFLREHVERFRALGIRLASVETALIAQLRFLSHLERLEDACCIIQLLDGMALLSILWAHGEMIHFSRTRLRGQGRSAQIGAGCAGALDPLLQFARTQKIDGKIREVYIGGLTESELKRCGQSICQLDPALQIHPFRDVTDGFLLWAQRTTESDLAGWEEGACEPGRIAAAIGGLLTCPGRQWLLFQYKRDPEMMARRKAIFRFYMPFLGTVALLTSVVAAQGARWFYLSGQVDRCLAQIADPQVLAGIARYDKLTEENTRLRERLQATEKVLSVMQTYPVMSTKIDQVVERCAEDLVTAKIIGFQADRGMVLVSCSAEDEPSIHQFIDRLAAEEASFSGIRYTGFEYVESEQVWRLSVECYLRTPGGEEGQP